MVSARGINSTYFEAESGLLINCKFRNEQIAYLKRFWVLTLCQMILVKCINCVFNVIWTEILANKSGENLRITNNGSKSGPQFTQIIINKRPISFLGSDDYPQCYSLQQLEVTVMIASF